MDDWIADDRLAFDQAAAKRNAVAIRLWSLVAGALVSALVVVAASFDPGSALQTYGPALTLLAVTALGLLLVLRNKDRGGAVVGPVSVAMVVFSGMVIAWVALLRPGATTMLEGGFLLVSLSAGMLFCWELPLSVAVQAGLWLCWLVGVAAGPGWDSDLGSLITSGTLLLGASAVAVIAQRDRRLAWARTFQQRREQDRASAAVDAVRASQIKLGRARDRLFSDVTNGLREPVVRLLRATRDQIDAEPGAMAHARASWVQGLRLLRKLDDVGTVALYQRGHLRLRVRRANLREELTAMIERARSVAGASGVTMDLFIHEVPDDVHVDPERLERVIVVMLAETLRRCPHDADIQIEVGSELLPGQVPAVRIEVWCEAPEQPIDRAGPDEFWREPEGMAVDLRLAHTLAEFHGGHLVVSHSEGPTLSAVLTLRSGTQHLTDAVVDRRVRAVDSDRGRRFEDRDGMTWAASLARTVEYRYLEVHLMAQALASG
ncbi:MAG: hypothetical protein GXP62_09545 [Oligoflexia bacterium]|nr:hypothetical protein [Oligoflexia bacterium]